MKKFFISAVVFLILFALFVFPGGILRGEKNEINLGYEMYPVQITQECNVFSQSIRNSYSNLAVYGFYVESDCELAEGGIELNILHGSKTLFSRWIDYTDLNFGQYDFVDLDVFAIPFSLLDIELRFVSDADGNYPCIYLSPQQYNLREMKELSYGNIQTKDSLISNITYSNAIGYTKQLLFWVIVGIVIFTILDKGVCRKKIIFLPVEIFAIIVCICILVMQLENSVAAFPRNQFEESGNSVYRWSIFIVLLEISALMLVFQSISIGGIVGVTLTVILYSTDYYVRLYRDVPFRINDLRTIETVSSVIGGYSLKPSINLAICWLIAILLISLFWHLRKSKIDINPAKLMTKWQIVLARIGVTVVGLGLLSLEYNVFVNTDFLEKQGFYHYKGISYIRNYQINGYLVASAFELKNSKITVPQGYSEGAVSEILEDYGHSGAVFETPNIIYILNESLADLNVLGDIDLSENILENFYSIENATRGYVNVSSIGGGTANSEFEALTGCSMAFLPNSYYPYFQAVDDTTPSVVGVLKENGYKTVSIHPNYSTNYNRKRVYTYWGFDEQYWVEDFENAPKIKDEVSDMATYEKIISLFENKGDSPLFIFDVTMQNHGGYSASEFSTIYSQKAFTEESSTYFTAIKETDIAFKYLVDYFSSVDEPTIICMFGDHQPLFEDNSFYESIGNTDSSSLERYKTPFIIWANYEIENKENVDIGLCYLAPFMFSVAQVRMSPYMEYALEIKDAVPIISQFGCTDSEGNYYASIDECNEINELRLIQYDFIFGKKKKSDYYR